jgi:hypothetical protein
MEAILLVVIGFALALSIAGYFFFSRRVGKSDNTYYWKPGIKKNNALQKIKQEFILNDRNIRAYKETIGFSMQYRNISNQVMNETAGLFNQKAENQLIRYIDLQVLEQLQKELGAVHSNSSALLFDEDNRHMKELGNYIKKLNNNFSELSQLIDTILQANDDERNEITFMQEAKLHSENLYHEIISIHEGVIGSFQEYFSETP